MHFLLKNRYLVCIGSGLLFSLSACEKNLPEPVPMPAIDSCAILKVTYTNDIAPIISTNCTQAYGCHGSGAALGDFTTYEGLMQKVNGGKFYARVIVTRTMPLNSKLSHSQLQKIQCWLDAGAPNN